MLEKEIIQYRGFRNTLKNGVLIGFQFDIRTRYYRGLWLSQIRPGRVTVDGEEFSDDKVSWEIDGVEYAINDMATNNRAFWPMDEAATIKVKKQGGLAQGYHDVGIHWGFSSSYLPLSLELSFEKQDITEGFMRNTFLRKMLIV